MQFYSHSEKINNVSVESFTQDIAVDQVVDVTDSQMPILKELLKTID
jgi:hypothetical protein